ncbi:flagellar biosynthesis protein FlhB [Falsihalocynthiibacter sp. SS001]|uniref:EscU/YscU/HrcU family type III secretion system export apparatus switch protein n=1 Tax=Falsihalocynthiibacter sp. SS001 TaxID=3349698 RepID=UPI0036D3C167
MSEDDSDKQHEPTQKKLDDARKKGEIPRSTDLLTAASYSGFLITAFTIGGSSLRQAGQDLSGMISRADQVAPLLFEANGSELLNAPFLSLLGTVAFWFGLPALMVTLTVLAQRSFVVAPEKLAPKLSRISPLSNAQNKFGRSGLFEFGKSFLKLAIFSIVLGAVVLGNMEEIIATVYLSPQVAMKLLFTLFIKFLFIVLIVSVVIGAADFLFQHQEHMRKNRMSHKEMTDEHKSSEGDPHIKQQRRQKGYEIAMTQMMGSVPEADVIIVNPTHYAVALKWDRTSGAAPICVAKGVDEIAAAIREIAMQNGVPIHSDPPTARAIYATVEIDAEIQRSHYQAVAAAIRFAEKIRQKSRTLRG